MTDSVDFAAMAKQAVEKSWEIPSPAIRAQVYASLAVHQAIAGLTAAVRESTERRIP